MREVGRVEAENTGIRTRAQLLWNAVAILAVALVCYFVFRVANWHEVWFILSHANLPLLLFTWLILGTGAYFLRALRWRLLLHIGKIRIRDAFWANSIGYLANNFLPARAGELVRTGIVSSMTRLSRTFVLTTVICERAVDFAVLMSLAGLVGLTSKAMPRELIGASQIAFVLALLAATVIAVGPSFARPLRRLLRHSSLPIGIRYRSAQIIREVAAGIGMLHNRARLAKFLSFTVVIWLLDGLSTTLVAHSLGISLTYPTALLLLAALGVASIIPATPGQLGVFQLVTIAVLKSAQISREASLGYSLVLQGGTFLVTTILGLLGLLALRQFRATAKEDALPHSSTHTESPA